MQSISFVREREKYVKKNNNTVKKVKILKGIRILLAIPVAFEVIIGILVLSVTAANAYSYTQQTKFVEYVLSVVYLRYGWLSVASAIGIILVCECLMRVQKKEKPKSQE